MVDHIENKTENIENQIGNIETYIDHTNLSAYASKDVIVALCEEAKRYNFAAVCVNPYYVELAASLLKDSQVKVCTVIGFPLGYATTNTKAYETTDAIENGAQEIDMVINIAALKNNDESYVKNDIAAVVKAANQKAIVKVIIETCYLDTNEIVKACQLAMEAGADYVKTSTGFGSQGAQVEDVKSMRVTVGTKLGVKASGGIKDRTTAIQMIEAGASRIGTSSGVTILTKQ